MTREPNLTEVLEQLDLFLGDNDAIVRSKGKKKRVIGVFPK